MMLSADLFLFLLAETLQARSEWDDISTERINMPTKNTLPSSAVFQKQRNKDFKI